MSEASVATSNSLEKSGSLKTGAVVKAILSCWKARSVAGLHSNWACGKRSVNGEARELKLRTNQRKNWANPWKLRMSNIDCGVGQSRMAVVLAGSTAMPAAEMTNPRYATDFFRNEHLVRLAYNCYS